MVLVLTTLSTAVFVVAPRVATAAQPELVPLWTWFSPGRGDYLTTSDPAWTNSTTLHSPDYRFVRVEGQVLNPANPKPPSTNTLYRWFSSSRGDNFLTSDPAWASTRPGEVRNGYQFVRLEGHAYNLPYAGTVQLESSFHSSRLDNRATADPGWTHLANGVTKEGYRVYRVEGYVRPPATVATPLRSSDFGYGAAPLKGARPLLGITVKYDDRDWFRSNHTNGYFDRLLFGPSGPNVKAYTREISAGTFTWNRTSYGVVGQLGVKKSDLGDDLEKWLARVLTTASTSGRVNFADFAGSDGRVDPTELGVVVFDSRPFGQTDPWNPGSTRPTIPGCIRLNGVDVCVQVASVGEDVSLSVLTHELDSHVAKVRVGSGWADPMVDVYGSRAHNFYFSLAAAVILRVQGQGFLDSYHADPFFKARLGWVEPRIVPITAAPGCTRLRAQQEAPLKIDDGRPVILYDPSKGAAATKEYFMLEYRTPRLGGYDAFAGWTESLSSTGQPVAPTDRGMSLWWVRRGSDGLPEWIQVVNAGWNGTLETAPVGDDKAVGNVILPGADRVLQTTTVAGDDTIGIDRNLMLLGAPNAERGAADSRLKGNSLWKNTMGEFGVQMVEGAFSTTSPSALRLLVAPDSNSTVSAAQWRFNGLAFRPRLDRIANSGLTPGGNVDVQGELGVRPPEQQQFRLHRVGASTFYSFTATGSHCNQAFGRIPSWVPPGEYDLTLITGEYSSNILRVKIT